MDVLLFLLSMLAGFFIIAIPWSGILLLVMRQERDEKSPIPKN